MTSVPLNSVFEVGYGHKLDLNKLKRSDSRNGIAFVGRSRRNLGVTAYVEPLPTMDPYPAGWLTVALGGASVLYTFVQQRPFYTAQNVGVLQPPSDMTDNEKLWYALCIRRNAWRYHGFGREANRTFRTIPVPPRDETPSWALGSNHTTEVDASPIDRLSSHSLNSATWAPVPLRALFDVRKGKRLTKQNMSNGSTPFIGSSDANNGVTALVGQEALHEANTISVCYNGSVGEAFYQPVPFWCSDDVNVLYPKFDLTALRALFICTLIRKERYRFNYGRKWHLERMRDAEIRLPIAESGEPDWDWIDAFMRERSYSKLLLQTES